MSNHPKPWRTYINAAHILLREADLADKRADLLATAALTMQANGDPNRAEAMCYTCRKIRMQALLDRGRAAAAGAQAATKAGRRRS